MRDGTYALQFSADGYECATSMRMQANQVEGSDSDFRVMGGVRPKGNHAEGTFDIVINIGVLQNGSLPSKFTLKTTGSASDTDFDLVGAGPLGLIVELVARWVSPGTRLVGPGPLVIA